MSELNLPETRYALSDDVSIAYQVMGEGLIDIIMVPGLFSHVEFMHELPGYTASLRRLSRFARVVSFDKRGQGLSDRMTDAPSLEKRMNDVRAVMDDIGSHRAVLFGFSEGCPMSALFAATYPDRVSHLILVGGYSRAADRIPDQSWQARLEYIIKVFGSGEMVRTVIASQSSSADAVKQFAKLERLSSSPGAVRTLLALNRQIDVTPILPTLRVPTLVMHRKTDAQVPVALGRKLAQLIPDAKYIEYPEGDHAFWVGDVDPLLGDIEEFVTGYRHAPTIGLERVLATVLFTDIVDSTRSAAEIGDERWRRILDDHDRLAEELVREHRGNLVKNTGDGILATFDGPGRAVRCALAIGSAAGKIDLHLRSGLHTGEIELRGKDIGGIAVHAAARVMAQCGPHEVLVSRVVTDLVAGTGLKFVERGSFELKGLPGRWEIYAATG